VQLNGKTATGIEVPAEVVAGLGPGQRPPVRVTIGDYSYRTTVARMGGRFLVSLSAENRAAAGVAAGDEVDVDLELDDAPREVEVPAGPGRESGAGCVCHNPRLPGPVCHNPRTTGPGPRGMGATTPVYRGLCATTPKKGSPRPRSSSR
jgi:hypothetical protein